MTHGKHIAIRKGILREKQCEKVFVIALVDESSKGTYHHLDTLLS